MVYVYIRYTHVCVCSYGYVCVLLVYIYIYNFMTCIGNRVNAAFNSDNFDQRPTDIGLDISTKSPSSVARAKRIYIL